MTNKAKVHELIENFGYNYQKLAEQKFFFETLYVYLIEKSEFLNQLEKYNIRDIQKLTKGHRGVIYTGYYNHAKVAIKTKNPESKAVGRMINEARWLKLLNRQQIGPEIFAHQEDFFIYKFIEGVFFPEFIINATKPEAKKVIIDVFNQCYKMDELKINKEEMQNPYKHIIVGEKTTLLDFERAHKTEKPHNANQFCQYITSSRISSILKDKGFNIDKLRVIQKAKIYKKSINKRNFDNLIKEIK